MNFQQIIEQEWEKEYPESIGYFQTSIFNKAYGELIERICKEIWNQAIETAADNADASITILTEEGQQDMQCIQEGYDYEAYVLKESILKFKV